MAHLISSEDGSIPSSLSSSANSSPSHQNPANDNHPIVNNHYPPVLEEEMANENGMNDQLGFDPDLPTPSVASSSVMGDDAMEFENASIPNENGLNDQLGFDPDLPTPSVASSSVMGDDAVMEFENASIPNEDDDDEGEDGDVEQEDDDDEDEDEGDDDEDDDDDDPSRSTSIKSDSPFPQTLTTTTITYHPLPSPTPNDDEDAIPLEFTPDVKLTMISLLNGAIPEVMPIEGFDETAHLYWRLGTLVQFFNLAFKTPTVLMIKDLTPPLTSLRQMSAGRLPDINRYLRFWLRQFYTCDNVIDTLRFEPGQVEMTTVLVLNVFNQMRDTLPQLRPLFEKNWSPHLDEFTIHLQREIRYNELNRLISHQLENERVEHQETRLKKRKLEEELSLVRGNLEKSTRSVDRMRQLLEQAKKDLEQAKAEASAAQTAEQHRRRGPPIIPPSASKTPRHIQADVKVEPPMFETKPEIVKPEPLPHQSPPIHHHSSQPPQPPLIVPKNQLVSLLSTSASSSSSLTSPPPQPPNPPNTLMSSGGSGTITLSNGSAIAVPAAAAADGSNQQLMKPVHTFLAHKPATTYLSPTTISLGPRRRGRPRKNPNLLNLAMPTLLKKIKPNLNGGGGATLGQFGGQKAIAPAPMPGQTSLIIPAQQTSPRTLLSTGPQQVMTMGGQMITMQPQQSILTPGPGSPDPTKSLIVKKLKFPSPGLAPAPQSQQIFFTAAGGATPTMSLCSTLVTSGAPLVSLASGPLNLQLNTGPFIVQQQPSIQNPNQQSIITLQTVQPQTTSTSIIAQTGHQQLATPITITTGPGTPPSSRGPSLLLKSPEPAGARSPPIKLLASPPIKLASPEASVSAVPGTSSEEPKTARVVVNKSSPKYSMTKYYANKYPASKPIDLANLQLYYLKKSDSQVKCRLCSKRFPSMAAFEIHFEEHKTQRVFQCDWADCRSFFLSNYKLKRHRRTHTGERPFSCGKCDKTFTRSDKLREHEKFACGTKIGGGDQAGTSASSSTGSEVDPLVPAVIVKRPSHKRKISSNNSTPSVSNPSSPLPVIIRSALSSPTPPNPTAPATETSVLKKVTKKSAKKAETETQSEVKPEIKPKVAETPQPPPEASTAVDSSLDSIRIPPQLREAMEELERKLNMGKYKKPDIEVKTQEQKPTSSSGTSAIVEKEPKASTTTATCTTVAVPKKRKRPNRRLTNRKRRRWTKKAKVIKTEDDDESKGSAALEPVPEEDGEEESPKDPQDDDDEDEDGKQMVIVNE